MHHFLSLSPLLHWGRSNRDCTVVQVAAVKAPTLILSNTRDLRVPITESYKWFRALRDFGVEAEFVATHLDGHNPTDPYQ